MEPRALIAALDLGREDPVAEVLAAYPDAEADEAMAAEWAGDWTWSWESRFPRP